MPARLPLISNTIRASVTRQLFKITSQKKRKRDIFSLIEAFGLEQEMGGCNSLFFAENQLVLSKKRQSALTYKQAAMSSSSKLLSSIKLMDMESSTESFTDSSLSSTWSSTLSESAANYEPSQEDLQALQICGTPWLPQRDLENYKPKKLWNIFPFAFKKNSSGSNCENAQHDDHARLSTNEEAKPPPLRHFGYTAPLPRPSPWKEVYVEMIKPSEEEAYGAIKRQARWRGEENKQIKTKDIQELRRKLSKKIDHLRGNTSHLCSQNTPDKNIAGKDNLSVDYSMTDSSSDRSSASLNPESTCSSSASSCRTSIQSLDSFDELESSIANFYDKYEKSKVTNIRSTDNRKKGALKLHLLSALKENKVSPM